jgi:hypothetical protein
MLADLIGGLVNAGGAREARLGRDEAMRQRIVATIEQLITSARGRITTPSTKPTKEL